jgi:hypothetical protein
VKNERSSAQPPGLSITWGEDNDIRGVLTDNMTTAGHWAELSTLAAWWNSKKVLLPIAGRMEGYERYSVHFSPTDRSKKILSILYERRDNEIVFCPHWLHGRAKMLVVHLFYCISIQSNGLTIYVYTDCIEEDLYPH